MNKQKFIISSYANLVAAFKWIRELGFGKAYILEIKEFTRTIEQNSKLWAMLAEVSAKVNWHGQKLSNEDWKHIFSAAMSQQRVVPNIDSTGFVVLGKSTSKMSVAEMMDMIELIHAFGAQHGVKFKGNENE
jgi:hypothetical protein